MFVVHHPLPSEHIKYCHTRSNKGGYDGNLHHCAIDVCEGIRLEEVEHIFIDRTCSKGGKIDQKQRSDIH